MLRRTLSLLAVALVAITGCSGDDNTTTVASTDAESKTTTVVSDSLPAGSTSTPTPAESTVPDGVNPVELVAGAGVSVPVSGGLLPDRVVTSLRANGGELANTASFDARYETWGLPRVTGASVQLVAAESIVDANNGAWRRRDGMQWLFMDVSHDGIGALMDEMAAAAAVADWPVEVVDTAVGGGECVERTYTRDGIEWLLQGCAYPDFAGMYALGVTRSGLFTAGPVIVDPSVAPMVDVLDGELTMVSVRFEHPASAGSVVTLTVQAVVTHQVPGAEAVDAVAEGPLQGWTRQPGDSSVQFVGGLGVRWMVTDGEARLTGEGRLVL